MASRRLVAASATLLLMFTAGCGTRNPNAELPPMHSDRNYISQQEMIEHRFSTAWEVVESLRGRWLRSRGPNSLTRASTEVRVRMDDNDLGGVESLKSISVMSIVYIRWIDGITATGRWGLDHGQGVIYVSTRL